MGVEKVYPPRGAILDRNGYPLALTLDTYDIYISRKVWQDQKIAANGAQALSSVLGKTPEEIHRRAGVGHRGRRARSPATSAMTLGRRSSTWACRA